MGQIRVHGTRPQNAVRDSGSIIECTYGARRLRTVLSEEFRAGGEYDFVRVELPVIHGDGDIGVRAELRRNKGEMRNQWR